MAAAFPDDDFDGPDTNTSSVHITEFGDVRVNPQPIVQDEEETDVLLEEYLSPRKLRELTGVDDLDEIKFLEMRVETSETSLGNFGCMVPNLKQLKLNGSIIATVRDLGTSLDNLNVLWLARCNLEDLDGISSMSSLQELYLAYNDIADISPVSMLDNLQLLDLEGNNLDEISQVEFLALCPKLATLTLEGNPVCLVPTTDYNKDEDDEFDYRKSVRKAIPHLKILDDESMEVMPSSLGRGAINRSTDWLMVNESIKETIGSNDSLEMEGGRPSSASRMRPGTSGGMRPGSSMGTRPSSSMGNRPGSSMGNRPGTSAGQRPDTAGSDIQTPGEDCSDLTYGSGGVVCGNPFRALRNRRKRTAGESFDFQQQAVPTIFAAFQHQPEHTYYTEEEDLDQSKEDIFNELKAWKEEHEKKVSSRLKDREPQILKIDHGEDDNNNEDTLMDFDDDLGIHSVTPPANSPDFDRMPSPPIRPESQTKVSRNANRGSARPKTAGPELSYRMRRYKQRSVDDAILVDNFHSMRISQDEDTLTEDSGHSSPSVMPYSPTLFNNLDDRPFTGPSISNLKDQKKEKPAIIKSQPKIIDRHNPVIRSSTHTPPGLAQRLPGLLRPVTAKAALQRQPLPSRQPKI